MALSALLTILMPLITHLIDKLMEKDTTKMSEVELTAHQQDLACANGACELVKRIKA